MCLRSFPNEQQAAGSYQATQMFVRLSSVEHIPLKIYHLALAAFFDFSCGDKSIQYSVYSDFFAADLNLRPCRISIVLSCFFHTSHQEAARLALPPLVRPR